jgi:hypothetical protein
MSNPENPKIHPHFAAPLDGWRPTLEQRFYGTLAHLTQELDAGVYHAPQRVLSEVSNFVGSVKQSDCIARGDVAAFGQYYSSLNLALRPLRRIE